MHAVVCARVALRWTMPRMHAARCMQAAFVSRVRRDTPRISLAVTLPGAPLLPDPSIWSFRSYCFWSTEPPLIAPDVIRTTPLKPSAVTEIRNYSDMKFYGASVKRKNPSQKRAGVPPTSARQ